MNALCNHLEEKYAHKESGKKRKVCWGQTGWQGTA